MTERRARRFGVIIPQTLARHQPPRLSQLNPLEGEDSGNVSELCLP